MYAIKVLLVHRRQVGGQQPGFLFADFPVRQDIDRIGVQVGQLSLAQPQTLTGLAEQACHVDDATPDPVAYRICDLTKDSYIAVDGETVYRNGKFV